MIVNGQIIFQSCVVIKKLSNPIILEYDFVTNYNVLIDPHDNEVHLRKVNIKVAFEKSEVMCYSFQLI